MAKSTKHQDKIGSFESFRAPWETESGGEVDVDKTALKRLLFNLKLSEAKALDAQDDAKVSVTEAETERDEAKTQAANANPAEAQKQIDKLTKQVTDLTAERDGLVKAKETSDLRSKVLEGVDPKVAKYVVGDTEEELTESLKAVKADFGIADEADEDAEDDEPEVRTRPRSRLRNGSDPVPDKVVEDYDFDKAADEILGGTVFR